MFAGLEDAQQLVAVAREGRGARDLLRHKNSNVTRAIYRAHFDDRRREQLRARMETRMETSRRGGEQEDDGSTEREAS